MENNTTTNATFHTPRRDQGQIVEVSYALVEVGSAWLVIRRTFDGSDRSVEYAASPSLADDQGDYWDAAPANKRWRTISEAEFRQMAR